MDHAFNSIYKKRRVLITGHTGFKGSWLALWLTQLKAEVFGFSLYMPSEPCNYTVLKLSEHMRSFRGDIRDFESLQAVFHEVRPEIVFHLAAQPIVKKSFEEPKLTFDTNIGGTVNLLECLKNSPETRSAVIITSDKCYQNVEWIWGYRENDRLGGTDPYSASKACAELAVQAYCRSIFPRKEGRMGPSIATTRAGNVIGGGDWAPDRIVPDCMRAWAKNETLVIRNPAATRPWQHVLEPLSGYLCLGAQLYTSDRFHGEAFNFGPDSSVNHAVGDLVAESSRHWEDAKWKAAETDDDQKKESNLLKLSCDKALSHLAWQATLSFKETVAMTVAWYRRFYTYPDDIYCFSLEQMERYMALARERGLVWAGQAQP